MKYQRTTIVVAAFAAGYLLKSALAPSSPAELLSTLERKIAQNQMKYEQVIDQTIEFAHQMKAEANPHPTKPGYVSFKDLKLVLKEEQDGDLTVLVNKHTSEEQPIQYVNGRTAVGTYEDRLESVKYETIQQGKQLMLQVREATKEKVEQYKDQIKDTTRRSIDRSSKTYNRAKEICSWSKEKVNRLYEFYTRVRNCLLDNKSKSTKSE